MLELFSIPRANGSATYRLQQPAGALWQIGIRFAQAPSAGTVKLEYKLIGDTQWRTVPQGDDVDLTGPILVYAFGAIERMRTTVAGLVGGKRPQLWMHPAGTMGFLPLHFTDNMGSESRLQVDVAQTGFFKGREFRTFRRLSIAAASVLVIRVVAPIDLILFGLDVDLVEGELDVSTQVGGTEGGTFSETLPIIARNSMASLPSPVYTPQAVITAGGTLTSGTEIDALVIKAANNSNFAATVGTAPQDERGIAAGTYYFVLTAAAGGTARGVMAARWEERPAGPL